MIDNIIQVQENPNLALQHSHRLSQIFCKKNILIYPSVEKQQMVFFINSRKQPYYIVRRDEDWLLHVADLKVKNSMKSLVGWKMRGFYKVEPHQSVTNRTQVKSNHFLSLILSIPFIFAMIIQLQYKPGLYFVNYFGYFKT